MRENGYIFESRIRYSETGTDGQLTPEKLIDYFQDCSTFQSEDRGIGVKKLLALGLAWIIVYWRVEITRMPQMGEYVRIGTRPYQMKGSIGLRNFWMETVEGERLAVANSVWSLVEISSLRPVRVPADICAGYPLGERLDMVYDARKIRIPSGMQGTPGQEIIVCEYHLDTNHHMNNGQYVRIAAGLLPGDRPIRTLRIEYCRQAVLGDHICPVIYHIPPASETQTRDTELRAAELRAAGFQDTEPRDAGTRNTESRDTEPRDTEPQDTGTRDTEPRDTELRGTAEAETKTAIEAAFISMDAKDGGAYAILEVEY